VPDSNIPVSSNRETLDRLWRTKSINILKSEWFDIPPKPLPPTFDFGRIEGMMLGLAISDGLGNTTEGLLPSHRRRAHGEIRDYLPNKYADDVPVGIPSDDTQMAFWTLEQMLVDGCFKPENVADCCCRRRVFGIGSTVREFIGNRKSGKPWYECGPRSMGNGALMRIAPMVIPYLQRPTCDMWVDTVLSAMITHNDPGSISACVAFVNMLWQLLCMERAPEPRWWPHTYVRVAREIEGQTKYQPCSEMVESYTGPIWRFVEDRLVNVVYRVDPTVLDACSQWHSGAYLLETVPSVLYILMRHGRDPEEAIVRAVNDTKDNDTIAAIVGAAVGALHGREALPKRWIENLSGRTTDSDDGQVFRLLESAKQKWWLEC
jgi:ADP-ribosylglycohydrolase